ncbi:hypothetical protein T484DRAFT_3649710 [Baffinella frigidus]|nr:hypothetical protein T484DRAFT_3649710 [Cryptophyta sp. CCMP2293]
MMRRRSQSSERTERLERLQAHIRMKRGQISQSPKRHSLPSSPGPGGTRSPLAAESASLPSIASERAPALDEFSVLWHMPGHEAEQCSMCKTIGMEVPCRCMPVTLPLLSGSKAWRVLGRRFQAADAAQADDAPAQHRFATASAALLATAAAHRAQHPVKATRQVAGSPGARLRRDGAPQLSAAAHRDLARSRALARSGSARSVFV